MITTSTKKHNTQKLVTLYHVTTSESLNSIFKQGLIPQVGDNAFDCGEKKPAIYFFPTKDTMNDALGGWMGDLLEDNGEDGYCLTVHVPVDQVQDSTVDWEKLSYQPVAPENIEKEVKRVW